LDAWLESTKLEPLSGLSIKGRDFKIKSELKSLNYFCNEALQSK
jgi:hypothetical protein